MCLFNDFYFQRELVLRKELGRVRIPKRVYSFSYRIWRPNNWIITKHQHGETETIPTVIVDSPASEKGHKTTENDVRMVCQWNNIKL